MNFFKKAILVAAPAFLVGSVANAALVNGGFETGTTSNWGTLGNVTASTGVTYGVAGTVNPDSGTYAGLLSTNGVSVSTLASVMGISQATLEASNGGTTSTIGSLIYQTTTASAGDSFRFRWNFVEDDYVPWDDWAFYGISFNGGPATLTKFASLATVGPLDSGPTINGWTTLNVNIAATGSYTFYFGVVNALDAAKQSFLWIDNVQAQVLPPVTPSGVPDGGSGIALLGLAMTAVAGFRRKFGV